MSSSASSASSIFRKRKAEYYEILGVPFTADEEELKRAYKKKALEYHPDRINNHGNEEEAGIRFHEVTEAFRVLQEDTHTLNKIKNVIRSPDLQNALDSLFMSHASSPTSSPPSPSSSIPPLSSPNIIHTPSASIFPSKPRSQPKRGQSLKAILHLSLEESRIGCVKNIEYSRALNCIDCDGSGSLRTSAPLPCSDCCGSGFKTTVIHTATLGDNSITTSCRTCHTSGVVGAKDCSRCEGNGKTTQSKTRSITVPSGVSTGHRLQYEGEGDEGIDGGPSGDLNLWFEVEGSPLIISTSEARKRGRRTGSNRKIGDSEHLINGQYV